ncbi:MAG: hypothetical protein Q7W02_21715 [Candidatus Rokubacteria bacterium]|nr:hypothetical protein [Candidatus Rokubacteria bacterium]
MEYYYYSVLSWLLLLVCGLPFSFAWLPRPLKRYSLAFAPSIGYCYVVFVTYYGYRSNLAPISAYAFSVLALPVILLALYAVGVLRAPAEVREICNARVGLITALTVVGFVVVSIPFLAKHGQATSLSLGNLDIAELAGASRFLQEFARNSQVGFLGQGGHFAWTSDDVWFGPSAIVAFASSILSSEPYKLQSLVMNVLACQGIPFLYLLARESLAFSRASAIGVTLLYAINPVVVYTVWQSFGGQMISMGLMLALLFLHTFALREGSTVRDYLPFAPAVVIFFSGLLLTYHFMLLVIGALLVAYTAVHEVVARRLSKGLKLAAVVLVLLGVSLLLNPFRLRSIGIALSWLAGGNNGWFIPWLSPDVLVGGGVVSSDAVGPDPARIFLAGQMPSGRAWFVAMAVAAFVVSVVHAARGMERRTHLSFLLGLFVPLFLVGLYFAVVGSEGGILGSYRSSKITATFSGVTLLGLALGFQTTSWRDSRLKVLFAGVCFIAVAVASVKSDKDLVRFMAEQAFVLPEEIVELKKIESLPFVKGINVLDTDNFTLFWINYFTMRKPQVYQRFPYGGRPVGFLSQDYYLAMTPAARSSARDIFFVEATDYKIKYDINPWFVLYQGADSDLTLSPGEGWSGSERTHRWCGNDGRSCSVFVDSRTEGVKVSLETRYLWRRDGETISVAVNGQPVRSSETKRMLVTEPFSLRAGRNVVKFTSSLDPVLRSPHDPRMLLIAWQSIVVRLPKSATEGTR